jgi:hypothetical protein
VLGWRNEVILQAPTDHLITPFTSSGYYAGRAPEVVLQTIAALISPLNLRRFLPSNPVCFISLLIAIGTGSATPLREVSIHFVLCLDQDNPIQFPNFPKRIQDA